MTPILHWFSGLTKAEWLDIAKAAGPVLAAIIVVAGGSWGIGRQLRHDRKEKAEERRVSLLREVYLEAFEAVSADFQLATRLLFTISDDPLPEVQKIGEQAAALKPYYTKIMLVGSLDVIEAFGKLKAIPEEALGIATARINRDIFSRSEARGLDDETKKIEDELTKPDADRESLTKRLQEIKAKRLGRPLEIMLEVNKLLPVRRSLDKRFNEALAKAAAAARTDLGMKLEDEKRFAELVNHRIETSQNVFKPLEDMFGKFQALTEMIERFNKENEKRKKDKPPPG